MPKIAMPTAATAMTAYWPRVSFSFRMIRLHSREAMQYEEIMGAATTALAPMANT